MKAVKIESPLWLGTIALKLNGFVEKLPTEGVTYESLYTFLATVIQHGKDVSEFWCVFDKDKPVAFGRWEVRGLPHIGKVYGDCFYSWAKNPTAINLLVAEFINFGKKHRALIYEVDFADEHIYNHFNKILKKHDAVLKRQTRINCIGRLK